MSTSADEIAARVRSRAERGEFLGQLILLTRNQSSDVHEEFIAQLSRLAVHLRDLFIKEELIQRFARPPTDYWDSMIGTRIAFVDGGVARIDLPSAAPMGIRVGAYTVNIGDDSDKRESFSTELCLVDELFSADGWTYEDAFEDTQKLTDAARIVSEASAAARLLRKDRRLRAVLLHGPLINPVSPYGTPGFPSFSTHAAQVLLGSPCDGSTDRQRHFVSVYKAILDEIRDSDRPVVGVVERSIAKRPVLLQRHIQDLQTRNVLSSKDASSLLKMLDDYRLNDASVLSVVLATGEYLSPIQVNRQLPKNKWPNEWAETIEIYPSALTTYLKCGENSEPFRVELSENAQNANWAIELVYQTARLLPQYGFPVGLDIADKYAKVPAWMTRGVRRDHAVVLLRNALRSGEPKVVDFAKKALTAKGRDWLFRPKA